MPNSQVAKVTNIKKVEKAPSPIRNDPVAQQNLYNRLYKEAIDKEKFLEKKKEEYKGNDRTCTFQPNINKYKNVLPKAGIKVFDASNDDGSQMSQRSK